MKNHLPTIPKLVFTTLLIFSFSFFNIAIACDFPAFNENGDRTYAVDDIISRNGKDYKVVIAGWANASISDWAYAPGTGQHWGQAWSLENDPCTGGGTGGGTGDGTGGGTGTACIVTEDDGQAQATYYTLLESGASSVVTCSFDAVADIKGTFYGALETKTLHGSGTKPNFSDPAKYCGMCVEMTGPKSTEIVHITDECPDCHEHNTGNTDIDLSTPAFNAIVGDIGIGRADITWKEVPCPWTSPLQVIIQGSNEWSAKVIIANHVNRIASVEVMFGGSWQQMTRLVDNGWNKGNMNGTAKDFRITDIYGSEIIVTELDFSANPTNSKNFASTNFPACGLTQSTGEINNLDYISIYPNPANKTITLEGLEDVETIQIINLNGQVMLTEFLGGSASIGSIDISNLAKGIYVAKMTGLNSTGTATFVKK